MTELEQIEAAIAALESQRAVLGETVVETALGPLREKLAALRAASASPEQRKQVTILFGDIVDFTALAERLDPEDVREVLNAYFSRWRAAIARYGGAVEKFIGDAVMAVFGLTAASEIDPENAVRAALAMRDSLAELNEALHRLHGLRLSMRVGIHTGPALVNIRLDDERAFAVMGDTVNLASRLETSAPADGVLISHATYLHVRGVFSVQAQEPLRVKGRSGLTQTYLVLREKPRAFRVTTRGVEGIETRLVGRRAELRQLQDAFQTAFDDARLQACLIVAEAGVGKSRLLYELDNWIELQPDRSVYFRGRASPELSQTPYALLRSVLTFRFEILENDPPAVARRKLEDGLTRFLSADEHAAEKAHFIGHLIGFGFADSPHLQPLLADSRQIRDRALHYFSQVLAAAAHPAPRPGEPVRAGLVMLLEDIHWADEPSLEAIAHLAQACAAQPFFLVCLARPSLFETHARWGEGLFARIDLQPLAGAERRELVEELLSRLETLPGALRDLLAERAEGNPFYTEELVKMLIDDGVIVVASDGPWRIAPGRLASLRVPATLVGVLQARLDGLAAPEREALQRAAVVGRVFWDSAVSALDSGADPQPVLDALRRKELIYQRESSAFAGATEYTFKHAILRDVTYESVLRRSRRAFHARAAEWLIANSGERAHEFAGSIAEHFEQSGDGPQAAEWYGRAGRQAAQSYAPESAIDHLRRALALQPHAPADTRLSWLNDLGRALIDRANYAEAEAEFQAMRALAEQANSPLHLSQAWNGISDVQEQMGNYKASLDSAVQAEAAAARAASRAGEGPAAQQQLLKALYARGWAMFRLGQGAENVLAIAEQLLQLSRQSGVDRAIRESQNLMAIAWFMRGELDQTIYYFEQALESARRGGDRQAEISMLSNIAAIAEDIADYDKAIAFASQARALCLGIGERNTLLLATLNLGSAQASAGDYERAEANLRLVLDGVGDTTTQYTSQMYSALAETYLGLGRLDDAAQAAQQALQAAQATDDVESIALAWQALGKAASRLQQPLRVDEQHYEPAQCFAEGLRLATEFGVYLHRAGILRDWARHERAAGDRAHGDRLWAEALAIFKRLRVTREVARMEAE